MQANYKNNEHKDFSALPSGNYEMIIKSAQEKATKNGAESLQLDLVVRNDLDGVDELKNTNAKYHNRHVFMDNWKRKTTNQYDLDSFQYILEAVQIPEGTPLNTINDFTKAVANKPAKVYVKKTVDDYGGEKKDINQIAPWNLARAIIHKCSMYGKTKRTVKIHLLVINQHQPQQIIHLTILEIQLIFQTMIYRSRRVNSGI